MLMTLLAVLVVVAVMGATSMFDTTNMLETAGIRGAKSPKDPLKSSFAQYGSGHLFYGLNWAGLFDGSLWYQGTFGNHPWRAADWLITAIGGAGTTLTPADAAPPKATFLTRATADGDGYNMQWSMDGGTTGQEVFLPTANSLIIGYFKGKVDNAADDAHTKSRAYFGIGDLDTDIHGSVGNFIGGYKASGAAALIGITDATAQDSAGTVGSFVNNTNFQFGFRVEGVTLVNFWWGTGTRVGDLEKVQSQTDVTDLSATEMCLQIQGETSEAAAITFHLEEAVVFQQLTM